MKKSLIFDLDGTLWETEKSYYYAFNQYLLNHPEVINEVNAEEIKNFKGITMDKMAPLLFPKMDEKSQYNAILECLKYSCEYLIAEENTIDQKIIEIIKTLNCQYDLYIVSNCPKEYIDIFFKKTSLKNYFKEVIALGGFTKNNDYDKGNNLLKLLQKHQIKEAYFVGDNLIDLKMAKYASLPFIYVNIYNKTFNQNIYDEAILTIINNEQFLNLDAEIKKATEEKMICSLTTKHYVFINHDAKVILMENLNQQNYQYLFGFLNLSNQEKYNQEVFLKLENKAKEIGAKTLVGPINYCTWFDYRLPLNEFDWHLLPDIVGNKENIENLCNLGFKTLFTYSSTLSYFNQELYDKYAKVKLSSDYSLELLNGEEINKYVKEIFIISQKSFKQAYLYSDIPYELFEKLYVSKIKHLPIDLLIVKKQNQVIAFGLCYPDDQQQMYVCKTVAIDPRYQATKVILKMAEYVYIMASKHQMKQILYHFQNEQKNTLSAFWRNEIIRQKRYAIFIKELN